jgi:hypothetical protein
MTDVKAILAEREKTNGDYATLATISQSLKQIAQMSKNWDSMNDAQREAIEMMAHKWARILNGEPHFRDHWDDIAGYATLASIQSGMALSNVEKDLKVAIKEAVTGLPKVTTSAF